MAEGYESDDKATAVYAISNVIRYLMVAAGAYVVTREKMNVAEFLLPMTFCGFTYGVAETYRRLADIHLKKNGCTLEEKVKGNASTQ